METKDIIRDLRMKTGLSQEALAEKLGVSRQAVSKWESGVSYPEMDKVIQICNYRCCSYSIELKRKVMKFVFFYQVYWLNSLIKKKGTTFCSSLYGYFWSNY